MATTRTELDTGHNAKARAAGGLDLVAMREELQARKDALMGVEMA